MKSYYLAIDIGASGGRFIAGHKEKGRLLLQEMYRFYNGPVYKEGEMCWDMERIFREIKRGLKGCREAGIIPKSMGIDTWGLDFVLLDEKDRIIGNAVSHRDKRTKGIYEEMKGLITREELYRRTGVQMAEFNTSCQLLALDRSKPEMLKNARTFLMIPDYLNYLLTGVKLQEYTNASITQLCDPRTREWDKELLKRLGLPEKIFLKPQMPGKRVGSLCKEVEEEVGFSCPVRLPPTHDTASAFMAALPLDGNTAYISSGTWSLMGLELETPCLSRWAGERGFTNEAGFGGSILYLKNSMGLWLIQQLKKEGASALSFEELCGLAEEETTETRINCNDNSFLAPASICRAIDEYCEKTGQKKPESIPGYAAVIYHSLAMSYAEILRELETITGRSYENIHIFGGGSKAGYLNQLTASYTGKTVFAGPAEATAIGNLITQMIEEKEFADLEEARECIKRSFDRREYRP